MSTIKIDIRCDHLKSHVMKENFYFTLSLRYSLEGSPKCNPYIIPSDSDTARKDHKIESQMRRTVENKKENYPYTNWIHINMLTNHRSRQNI